MVNLAKGVCVAVGDGGVFVGVAVGGTCVAVAVFVAVGVSVGVSVAVEVLVGVFVAVAVGVGVFVAGTAVLVGVALGVNVGVAVDVPVGDDVGEAVGVAVGVLPGAGLPVPLSTTVWGLSEELSEITSVAVRAPTSDGVKVTPTVQYTPCTTVAPIHTSKVTLKSPAFVPVMEMPLIANPSVPVLLMAMSCSVLLAPTRCDPKLTLLGAICSSGVAMARLW